MALTSFPYHCSICNLCGWKGEKKQGHVGTLGTYCAPCPTPDTLLPCTQYIRQDFRHGRLARPADAAALQVGNPPQPLRQAQRRPKSAACIGRKSGERVFFLTQRTTKTQLSRLQPPDFSHSDPIVITTAFFPCFVFSQPLGLICPHDDGNRTTMMPA